jgi:internalin A
MKRVGYRALLSFSMGLLVAGATGCDEKKEPDQALASAAPAPVPPPPPPTAEVEPVEAPKKKEPRVCVPGAKVADFAGDAAFEAQVRLKLSKPTGDISLAELGKGRSLNLAQSKVSELDPCLFPHMKSLKELFLGPGGLDSLAPLAGLKNLESLRASLNKVSDISPLAEMKKMDRLDLGHTQVKDLSPLAALENLTELQLDDSQVVDLSPLSGLKKLERLSIQRTQVKDLSPLSGLTSLKFLYIQGSAVDDKFVLSPLMSKGLKITD